MMNFIKIPQLLIPILFVVLSLSNAFAFAAEEEEIVAFQSELPSDASTYTIKQQGEHWNSPGWRIEGYTKEYVKFRAWRYFFFNCLVTWQPTWIPLGFWAASCRDN